MQANNLRIKLDKVMQSLAMNPECLIRSAPLFGIVDYINEGMPASQPKNVSPREELEAILASIESQIKVQTQIGFTAEVFRTLAELNAFTKQIENRIGHVEGSQDAYNAKLTGDIATCEKTLHNYLKEARSGLETSKFSLGRLEEYTKHLENRVQQLEAVPNAYDPKFDAAIAANDKKLLDHITDIRSTFERDTTARVEELTQYIAQARQDAEHITQKCAEIDALSAAAGASTLVTEFSVKADQEIQSGRSWRWWAVGCCGALVGYVLALIFYFAQVLPPAQYYNMFSAIVVLLIPFVYCAKESSLHFAVGREYRRKQLELAALGPYLSGLDKDKADTLKAELSKAYFCKPANRKRGEERTIRFGGDALKELIDYAIQAFRKSQQ